MTDMDTKRARGKCIANALICQLCWTFFPYHRRALAPVPPSQWPAGDPPGGGRYRRGVVEPWWRLRGSQTRRTWSRDCATCVARLGKRWRHGRPRWAGASRRGAGRPRGPPVKASKNWIPVNFLSTVKNVDTWSTLYILVTTWICHIASATTGPSTTGLVNVRWLLTNSECTWGSLSPLYQNSPYFNTHFNTLFNMQNTYLCVHNLKINMCESDGVICDCWLCLFRGQWSAGASCIGFDVTL